MLIRWQKTIVDQRGNVQPGAVLTIRRMSDQAIVTVYRDREGTQPYPTGTVTADENGYSYFYASPGLYRITSIQPAIDWPDESLAATFVTVGGGPYQTVAEGISSTSDGEYFFVSPSSQPGGLYDLYLNNGGDAQLLGSAPSLEAINELDSLVVNRGKIYPLNAAVRDGIVSPAAGANGIAYWNNSILRVSVTGTSQQTAGKYFRISALDNGFSDRTGIQIEEFDAATYSTASAATVIQQRTDGNFNYGAALGITSFVVEPKLRKGMQIEITVNGAALPPSGTPLTATTSDTPAWSWIVDPSCVHINEPLGYDSLRVNYDKPFPLRAAVRAGVMSPPNEAFNAALLSFVVLGAEDGRVYRPAYFVNEDTALPGADPFGWVMESYDAAQYATDDMTSRIRLHNYTDAAPPIDRAKGVQTIFLKAAVNPDIVFAITLDSFKLPPAGTSIRSLTSVQTEGRSWIIDQSQYVLRQTSTAAAQPQSIFVEATANTISWAWGLPGRLFRARCGPNGYNNLFNIRGLDVSASASPADAVWTDTGTFDTDCIPPFRVRKLGGTPGATRIFTGGNHGKNGDNTGGNTGFMTTCQVSVDGGVVGSSLSRYASRAQVVWINEVLAYNTVDTDERVLRQSLRVDMLPQQMLVACKVTNITDAPIFIETDYGPQSFIYPPWKDDVMFLGGQYSARQSWVASSDNSGPRSSYPEAWLYSTRGPQGFWAAWLDRAYGAAADVTNVDASEALIRRSTAKLYHGVIYQGETAGLELQPGESYAWRGGYIWLPPEVQTGDLDAPYPFGDPVRTALVYTPQDWEVV